MPIAPVGGSNGNGLTFLVAAGFMAEMLAFFCSSPQTAELQANEREATLMKWVSLGLAGGAVFVGAAAMIEPGRAPVILAGGAIMGAVAWVAYKYAITSGLQSGEQSTWKEPDHGEFAQA